MMTGTAENSNSYDTVKTRRRNPRQTLPVPSSSSDEGDEPGQNREAGETSVPPSRNSGQPGTSPPRIPNGQVKIRNNFKKKSNPNTNPTGTQVINQTPIGTHGTNHTPAAGTTSGKQKRSESKGRRGWSREENLTLMKLYYQSDPSSTGYRKRMYFLWQREEMEREAKEGQLASQVNSIKKGLGKTYLTDAELMELQALHTPATATSGTSGHGKEKKQKKKITGQSQEAGPSRALAQQPMNHDQTPQERERAVSGEERDDVSIGEWPASDPLDPAEDTEHSLSQAISDLRREVLPVTPEAPSYSAAPEELTSYQQLLRERIVTLASTPEDIKVKSLRHIDRKKLATLTEEVNCAVATIETSCITETNTLLLAAAHIVREELGEKIFNPNSSPKKDPWWKRRVEEKIAQDRSDISQLEELKKGRTLKKKITDGLNKRHPLLKKKGLPCVIEELKQRLRAKAAKIKRYTKRCNNFKQNKLFKTNQRQFYRNLNSQPSEGEEVQQPDVDKEAVLKYWKDLWTDEALHNADAPWIAEVKEEMSQKIEEVQQDLEIGRAHVAGKVKKMANWSTAGMDGLHVYWLKHLTAAHDRIGSQLAECLSTSSIPQWMTEGRTHLLIKDPSKGLIPGNLRPITCLPAMWKLLTGITADSMYSHLDSNKLLPTQQKGCKKNSRGCKEQLLIDKMILKNCRRRKTSLNMCFIDYKKAYDKVPHSWIIESMRMCGIAPNIISFFQISLSQSKVNLFLGKDALGTVLIKRGIFQGDSVSPLHFIMGLIPLSLILEKLPEGYKLSRDGPKINHRLYMDDLKLYGKDQKEIEELIRVTREFSRDICMEFGLEKCATLKMEKGKRTEGIGVTLPSGEVLKDLEEDGYRYLGILEADTILNSRMKTEVTVEYLRRLKKILKSGLQGKNCFQAINTWAVPVTRYGAGIITWTKKELTEIDRKTRNLLRVHRAHHPQGDVDRLYVSRKQGGRGLQSIEEVVIREQNAMTTFFTETPDAELVTLRPHLEKEGLLKGTVIKKTLDKQNDEEKRKTMWTEKAMHGQYVRMLQETGADIEESWSWLHQQDLKKETEGLILAAQDQALSTNYIKHRIHHQPGVDPRCRLCHSKPETVHHILSCCSKLSQTEYKRRHDNVAAAVHWCMCRKYQINCNDRWYEHRAEKVAENDDVKLLWDFQVQTDHVIPARRPDILIVKKKEATAIIIDISVPGDTRIRDAEEEKVLKYQDLKREIKTLWNLKSVKVVPIIVGALGAVTPNLRKHLDEVDCNLSISNIQKTALLGSARILRMVLDI